MKTIDVLGLSIFVIYWLALTIIVFLLLPFALLLELILGRLNIYES